MDEAANSTLALPDDLAALKTLIGENVILLRAKDLRIAVLEEQLALLRHKQFAASSEKFSPDQIQLFNEAEVIAATPAAAEVEITVPEHTRKKGGRKPICKDLPRVRVEHDISDAEKMCPCGSGLERPRIGEIVTEQYDIIPAKVQVLQHVRGKYGPCRQCDGVFPAASTCAPDDHGVARADELVQGDEPAFEAVAAEPRAIIVAPLPPQPIPKSNASPRVLAYIASMKFVDGLPLYRIESIFARMSVDLSRATMASWMIRLGELIVPLMNLMNETQLDYDILQMDETTVQVLKEDGRPAQSQSRMWVRRGGPPDKPIILFDYDRSRSSAVAVRLLGDFQGYLQTDGYEGYTKVGARAGIMHVACLSHARRPFDKALKVQKASGRGGLAAAGLALIQRIYRIEKVAREAGMNAEQRHRLRNEKSRPIWEELRQWLDRSLGTVPPQTLIGKALAYLDSQWPCLIRVLDDGRLEVDTNLIENAIRPFVIGRKAWLFSDTPAGAEASARLYSLIETAKANRCEPYAYLCHVFTELPKAKTLAEIEALLPWNFARPATLSVAA
jgi:transposase